ncbi:tyrosine-type recombinase/integrase [Gemmobacter serpentinus]|uniref:tyrosine-type recombinase/integrase n=1 Tax=Gemmobacter serpentinus TaxID=2652247 RepID=UPI00124F0D07|nr:integrase arm-type DNA-binding domain-containing protein [Gemmobacter serpentinus]
MALTDLTCKNAKHDPAKAVTRLADRNGLVLEVRPNGTKLWRLRYRLGGKANMFAIGAYPTLSLQDARKANEAARALIKQGINPAHNRRAGLDSNLASNSNTFETLAKEWLAKTKSDVSDYYRKQIETALRNDILPIVGRLPIRSVTAAQLLKVMQTAEARGAPFIARNIRQWCSAIFRYAIITQRAETDPAAALRGAVKMPRTKHAVPLSRSQIRELLEHVDAYGGHDTTKIAIKIMLLTFVRTVELRKTEWRHIDLERAEWRLPDIVMKNGEPHLVPLSRQAVMLFRGLHSHTGGQKYLVPNLRDPEKFMSATTVNRALERMGMNGAGTIGFSGHGFRATASTLLNELGFRADVIERQLAHSEQNKTRASYNQAEYLAERISMMQEWADLLDSI